MKRGMIKLFIIFLLLLIIININLKIVNGAIFVTVNVIPSYIPIDCTTGTMTPGDGTPIAVKVNISGGSPNTTYRIKSRVGFISGPYPSTDLTYAIWWANVGTTPYSWG